MLCVVKWGPLTRMVSEDGAHVCGDKWMVKPQLSEEPWNPSGKSEHHFCKLVDLYEGSGLRLAFV